MEKRRDVFQAIADPTRRTIIQLLAANQMSVNAIADHFDSSRPTISEHLRILAECGLVAVTKSGRERHCEARLEKLQEVHGWVEQYRKHWSEMLDSMENYLHELNSTDYEKRKRKQSKRGGH